MGQVTSKLVRTGSVKSRSGKPAKLFRRSRSVKLKMDRTNNTDSSSGKKLSDLSASDSCRSDGERRKSSAQSGIAASIIEQVRRLPPQISQAMAQTGERMIQSSDRW